MRRNEEAWEETLSATPKEHAEGIIASKEEYGTKGLEMPDPFKL